MTPAALQWLRALDEPAASASWTTAEWQRVLRLARRLRLMGRLAEAVTAAGVAGRLPGPVQRHVASELRQARWRRVVLRWTIERVGGVLADTAYPRVLLKGAAYDVLDLPFARGRLAGDLDILVPQAHLEDAQARLMAEGWTEPDLDPHDRRYYHQYSHEVPPMTHPQHAIELDLHHNILPPVGHVKVDAALLLDRLKASPWPGWWVLAPEDQVLHSAAHLFLDSEPQERLRDLVDMHGLLRHHATRPEFWKLLLARAPQLGLQDPLALALHFTTAWLALEVPQPVLRACPPPRGVWLKLLEQVLMPVEPDSIPQRGRDFAAMALLVRYHRRRMPMRLLLPHLWHKLRTRRSLPDDPMPPQDRR